jgi:hypothetical protein
MQEDTRKENRLDDEWIRKPSDLNGSAKKKKGKKEGQISRQVIIAQII